jgi:1-acyl-sn-glycerol-3-phosphate acyltransferase
MKEQVYKDPRPAEHFDRFHRRTRAKAPNWMYELVRIVLTPYIVFFYRARCIDSQHIPADGPAIIAPNHFSFLDHFFVAIYLRRKVNFMAKSQLFKMPLEIVFNNGGVFPVRRGHHDEEAFKTAHAILARGGIVVMYAEAGRSRSGELGLQFPKVTVQFGEPLRFEQVEAPTREQAQAASVVVFDRVKDMYLRLRTEGRSSAVRAARQARRAVSS